MNKNLYLKLAIFLFTITLFLNFTSYGFASSSKKVSTNWSKLVMHTSRGTIMPYVVQGFAEFSANYSSTTLKYTLDSQFACYSIWNYNSYAFSPTMGLSSVTPYVKTSTGWKQNTSWYLNAYTPTDSRIERTDAKYFYARTTTKYDLSVLVSNKLVNVVTCHTSPSSTPMVFPVVLPDMIF